MENNQGKWEHIRALELHKVLEQVAHEAVCEDAKRILLGLVPDCNFEEVQSELLKTDEAFRILMQYGSPPIHAVHEMSGILKRAKVGGTLSLEELLRVASFYFVIREVSDYAGEASLSNSSLDTFFWALRPNQALERKIKEAIISEEEMDDHASPALADIRRKIRSKTLRIREVLNSLTSSNEYQKKLQENIVTLRDNRYVLPIKAEFKGEVKGMVHDVSATGSTIFIEPMAVVEANNEIAILRSEEREEIQRILKEFTQEVALYADDISLSYNALIQIDVYFAKAKHALLWESALPELNQDGVIVLKGARHPLIDKKVAVPIDVNLGESFQTLIITGPNTGGKTVSLKTIGLFTLMVMCGLMIPVKEGSRISVFDNVFADIGEEQSIEQSLSTFSAHMSHIVEIVKKATRGSLVLLDELGSGTDPVEGAALATAILEYLRDCGATIAATTHYSELKIYALETEGVQNASCEFDLATLSPTYKLLIGVPGKSNAFAISSKLGLSEDILEQAEQFVSAEKKTFERVITKLDRERELLETDRVQMESALAEAERARADAKNASKTLKERQESEVARAREEARRILDEVRREANHLVNELDEIRKERKKMESISGISEKKSSLSRKLRDLPTLDAFSMFSEKEDDESVPVRPLKKGERVLVKSFGQKGIVIEDTKENAKTVQVQVGSMKTKVDISDIRLISEVKPVKRGGGGHVSRVQKQRTAMKQGSIMREIDVRGQNVEEAILEIDRFIADELLNNTDQISIIHGKGTGVLRTGVQDFLKRHKHIESYRLGTFGEGETGVTIAKLK